MSPSVAAILIVENSVARRDVTFQIFPSFLAFLLRLTECLEDIPGFPKSENHVNKTTLPTFFLLE